MERRNDEREKERGVGTMREKRREECGKVRKMEKAGRKEMK